MECEAKISERLDRLFEVDRRSRRSRSTRSSRAPRPSISAQSARIKEKAKVAELMVERSMLDERLKLKAAKEQLQLDLEIAKAKAREQAFTAVEEDQKPELPTRDDESRDSFLVLPTPASDRKQEPLPPHVNTLVGLAAVKNELEKKEPQQLYSASEFYYRAFPTKIKVKRYLQRCLQRCLASKRCSASGLNCRYLNPISNLSL